MKSSQVVAGEKLKTPLRIVAGIPLGGRTADTSQRGCGGREGFPPPGGRGCRKSAHPPETTIRNRRAR